MSEHTTTTHLSGPVDAFRLAYDVPDGPSERTVVLLHGWPADRRVLRDVVRGLAGQARCVTPDLRGFGGSDRHDKPPAAAYGGPTQARSVLGLLDELGIETATFVGYDIGSRTAQIIATEAPERVERLVNTPPVPGAGMRSLQLPAVYELWYQTFHNLPLIEALVLGVVPTQGYLAHFSPLEAPQEFVAAIMSQPASAGS